MQQADYSRFLGQGLATSRPLDARTVQETNALRLYFATDTGVLSLWVGTSGESGAWVDFAPTENIIIAASDETTALTTGTAKITFRMPYAFTLTEVRASLTTAQASGSIFTVDINEGGSSILSTKLTIDNGEDTSTTAATPAVISDASLANDAKITVDIDQIGNGSAAGLKVLLIGRKS